MDDADRTLSLKGNVEAEAWKLWKKRPSFLLTSTDREDMEQDAWLGAIQAARSWDGRGSLGGWAHRRIRGAVVDELRKRRSGRTGHEAGNVSLVNIGLLHTHDCGERVAAREELAQRLSVLTDRQRWLVVAHIGAGYGLKVLGSVTGVTESRVCQEMREIRVLLGLLPGEQSDSAIAFVLDETTSS